MIEREEAAFREMLDAYAILEKDIRRQIRELQRRIKTAQDEGAEISPSWFFRQRRLKTFLDQINKEIVRFGSTAAEITTREQAAAVRIAAEQTGELFRVQAAASQTAIGTIIPTRTVEAAVGLMGDGAPIFEYYRENLAPKVVEAIRSEVIRAAALGTDFNTVAKRLVKTGQITRSRALMVARTEVNRVRREATRQIYQENSDIITGWEWSASKSPLTCPVCLALDGRIFKLSEPFPQHPNCRCTMVAVIEGVPRSPRTLGKDWFDKQPDEIKEKIIGKEGLAAYKQGLIELKDFIGWKTHPQFGKSVYTKPLAKVLADKPIGV